MGGYGLPLDNGRYSGEWEGNIQQEQNYQKNLVIDYKVHESTKLDHGTNWTQTEKQKEHDISNQCNNYTETLKYYF